MDAKTFAREIETHVRPATFPVAAKLLGPEEPHRGLGDGVLLAGLKNG